MLSKLDCAESGEISLSNNRGGTLAGCGRFVLKCASVHGFAALVTVGPPHEGEEEGGGAANTRGRRLAVQSSGRAWAGRYWCSYCLSLAQME